MTVSSGVPDKRSVLRAVVLIAAYLASVVLLIALSWSLSGSPTAPLAGISGTEDVAPNPEDSAVAPHPSLEPSVTESAIAATADTEIPAISPTSMATGVASAYASVPAEGKPESTVTPTSTCTGTPSATPSATTTSSPTLTLTASATCTATPSVTASVARAAATSTPSAVSNPLEAHLWLKRPVGPEAANNRVDRFYPYGSTGEGEYPVHHGVEFVNPTGTVVLAVGPARVEVAGSDAEELLSYRRNFYGNVVVLRLEQKHRGKPLFVVYGHLSKIYVRQGQLVDPGTPLGEVGMSGVALGPHLHFEVRVGENSYWATRNPELWLEPLPGEGVIAGQVLNAQGKPLPEVVVAISRAEAPDKPWRQTWTYATRDIEIDGSRKRDQVNPDDDWPENWAMGDVPAGEYIVGIRVNGKVSTKHVSVKAGEVSYVTLIAP